MKKAPEMEPDGSHFRGTPYGGSRIYPLYGGVFKMSNDDLLQLWYLPSEIKHLQNEIRRLSAWQAMGDMQDAVNELLDTLKQRLTRCQAEYKRGMDFIQSIPDEWIREAFQLRYASCLSWIDVGLKMGLTSDCCRKMSSRFLERCGTATP